MVPTRQWTHLRGLVEECSRKSNSFEAGAWALVGCAITLFATALAESGVASLFAMFALILTGVASVVIALVLFLAAGALRRRSSGVSALATGFMDGISPPKPPISSS